MSVDFEHLCSRIASQKYIHISATFPEKSKEVVEALSQIMEDDSDSIEVYAKFIMLSVAADSYLELNEFFLIRPMLEHIAGKSVEYDEAVWMLMDMGFKDIGNCKETLAEMVDLFGKLPEELKDEIIELCLMVCAADGRITPDEKAWVKILAEPAADFNVDRAIEEILRVRSQ